MFYADGPSTGIFVTQQNVQGFGADNNSVFNETNPPVTESSNHPEYMNASVPKTMRRTAGRLGGFTVGEQSLAHSNPNAMSGSNDPAYLAEAFRLALKRF